MSQRKIISFIALWSFIFVLVGENYLFSLRTPGGLLSLSSQTEKLTLEEIIELLPPYLNLKDLAELNLSIHPGVSWGIDIGEFHRITYKINYQTDFGFNFGNIDLEIYGDKQCPYSFANHNFNLVVRYLYPNLPIERGLGKTLLWLLLVHNRYYQGKEGLVSEGNKDSRSVMKDMSDLAAFEFNQDDEQANVGFKVPVLTKKQQQAVDTFFKKYINFEVGEELSFITNFTKQCKKGFIKPLTVSDIEDIIKGKEVNNPHLKYSFVEEIIVKEQRRLEKEIEQQEMHLKSVDNSSELQKVVKKLLNLQESLQLVLEAREKFIRLGWVSRHNHTSSGRDHGSLSPKELVDLAIARGITSIYITGHHSIEGSLEAMEYIKTTNKIIECRPAIEIEAPFEDEEGKADYYNLLIPLPLKTIFKLITLIFYREDLPSANSGSLNLSNKSNWQIERKKISQKETVLNRILQSL